MTPRHHRRRHSLWGVAAVCVFGALVFAGPYFWPSSQSPSTASGRSSNASTLSGSKRARFTHSGPATPALLGGDPTNSATVSTTPTALNGGTAASGAGASNPTALIFTHKNIVTTGFWVGEAPDDDNGHISNVPSAWDTKWQTHFGGVDTPEHRNGYYPAGFIPKENPFYFALPYTDMAEDGSRKSSASKCAFKNTASLYSWCKNSWIAIRYNNKVVYAQWEDVGPFESDDTAYVFGTAAPANHVDVRAGLDVSPAVWDYLGLDDVRKTDWTFVAAADVPAGPWKTIVTTSLGDNTVSHN